MTSSIRTFLLINLLSSVVIVTSIAILSNLLITDKNLRRTHDIALIQSAFRIEAFLSDGVTKRSFHTIQKNIQKSLEPYVPVNIQTFFNRYHEREMFQVWDKNGRLILHSRHALRAPLASGHVGFSNVWQDNEVWRVYTLYDAKNKITVMVGKRSNFRSILQNEVTSSSIYIMLITYPFLGLLIWLVINKGVGILKKITDEISQRAPTYLDPVNPKAVPSEIKPVVQELNHLFARLRDAFDREKRFAADAAHELRTPLAALRTQVQVALKANDEDELKITLKKVLDGVDRSTHVVHQLLSLSRTLPEATAEHSFLPLKLSVPASEVAAQLVPMAIEKNIELSFDAPNELPPILGNSTSLNILIRNIVDNAIRYTPINGKVEIQVTPTDQSVILSVTDTGPGIPENLRKRVFQRFFRILGNKETGSGLGLSIIQQIARLHKAELLLLTPSTGKGLEIRVIFMRYFSK